MIRFLKIFFGTVFTLLILIGSCVFYAFKIEPYRIASNQLYLNEKTSDFIKVVQFSDTLLGSGGIDHPESLRINHF